MTGPEHYREAERLMTLLHMPTWDDRKGDAADGFGPETLLQASQVHATLALAAATALNAPHPDAGLTQADWEAWVDTASAHMRTRFEVQS